MSVHFLGFTSINQRILCLAQGHNAVPPVRLKPVLPVLSRRLSVSLEPETLCL